MRDKGDTYRPLLVLPQRYWLATGKATTLPTAARQTHSPPSVHPYPSSLPRPPLARVQRGSRRRSTVRPAETWGRLWRVLRRDGRRGGRRFRERRGSMQRWGDERIDMFAVRRRRKGRRCLIDASSVMVQRDMIGNNRGLTQMTCYRHSPRPP